jgi:hypothetical protein
MLTFSGFQGANRALAADNEVQVDGTLSVTGDVQAMGDYKFGKSRFFYLNIPPCAFQKSDELSDGWDFNIHYARVIGSDSWVHAYAPVYLPQGAVVLNVRFYYMDATSGDMGFSGSMWRRANDVDITSEDMVHVSTTTSGSNIAIQYLDDFSIGVPTIDNENYTYVADVGMNPTMSTTSLRFYGCRIKYALNTMLP